MASAEVSDERLKQEAFAARQRDAQTLAFHIMFMGIPKVKKGVLVVMLDLICYLGLHLSVRLSFWSQAKLLQTAFACDFQVSEYEAVSDKIK